jgi:hypothetical protein
MRRLTIAANSRITSVYLVEVPDDFDAEDAEALHDLALSDGPLLLSQTSDVDVTVQSDERV